MEPISQRGWTGFNADNGPKKMPFSHQYSLTQVLYVWKFVPQKHLKNFI